jgi:hypothetical protein
MRTLVIAAIVAVSVPGVGRASDPFNDHSWQKSRPPAVIAYFKMPLHAHAPTDKAAYGLALTAPVPRRYAGSPLLLADMPKIADLRFNGTMPESLRFSGQLAWSADPREGLAGERANLLGLPGLGGLVLGVALVGGAAYGLYTVVKKECPAISTSTGACVQPAN